MYKSQLPKPPGRLQPVNTNSDPSCEITCAPSFSGVLMLPVKRRALLQFVSCFSLTKKSSLKLLRRRVNTISVPSTGKDGKYSDSAVLMPAPKFFGLNSYPFAG